jgi:hypothetical protein
MPSLLARIGERGQERGLALAAADQHSTKILLAEQLSRGAVFRVDGSLEEATIMDAVVHWLGKQQG